MIWRGCSIRTSKAGSTTTATFIGRDCCETCSGLTPTWSAGAATSTSGSERRRRAHETGLLGSSAQTQLSLLIGACCMSAVEHREPYEPRGSRTDLGARGGEIPLRDSPGYEAFYMSGGNTSAHQLGWHIGPGCAPCPGGSESLGRRQ